MSLRLLKILAGCAALTAMTLATADAATTAALPARRLEPVVVQDRGFEKSLLSFAQERLALVGRSADLPDRPPVAILLEMIVRPAEWRNRELFRVEHPMLVEAFDGRTVISVNDYLSESSLARIRSLLREDPQVRNAVGDLDRRVVALADLEADLAIVPRRQGDWLTPLEFRALPSSTGSLQAVIVREYREVLDTYAQGSADAFAAAAQRLVAANRKAARAAGVSDLRIRVDLAHARLKPFRISALFYLFSALVYLGAISFGKSRLATSGVVLLALGLATHALGLTFRGILAGRAPMSNMYESLVFAVAGMTALAVVMDRLHRNALIGFAGAVLGFVFMVIAVNMPSEMHPLRPALQSSWLTYHVTTIMLSYSAFALSFFISGAYLLKHSLGGEGARYRWVRRLPSLESLDFFNYRIVAVGFPLLTVGIFTGAVWAATAWGRPWAFDPKETWSAITWLIYGIFLHTRLMGGWKGRPSAVLSLVGFAAVLFTYLGVNYLLPGLHSYV